MIQSCFSLGFLSGSSLHFERIRVFIVGCIRNAKSHLQPNRAFWRLMLAIGTSRELTAWPDWKFCLVVLQLSWPFSSPCMLYTYAILATCQSRGSSWVHTSWAFFTLSHTLPLHSSHLNIRYLIAKLQENLTRNKANTWLNKFNLTISPFGYSTTKP